MRPYLVCSNSKCLFLLDRRVIGRSHDAADNLINKCPSCGGSWSSTCPSCGQVLEVKTVDGRPQRVCCASKNQPTAEIAGRPSVAVAHAGA